MYVTVYVIGVHFAYNVVLLAVGAVILFVHAASLYQPSNIYPVLVGVYKLIVQFAYNVTVAPFVLLKFVTLCELLYTFAPLADVAHPLNEYVAVPSLLPPFV